MTMFAGGVVTGLNDVWVLANANGIGTPAWTQLIPTGGLPSARRRHTAIYDPATNRMAVFGGHVDPGRLNDVWVLANANGVVTVAVDIKPQSCPNPLNVKSKGVLSVAILGTDDFYVTNIDLYNNVNLEGIPPLRSAFEDVSTPFSNGGADPCLNCSEEGPDGKLDLVLKFDKQAVVEALGEVSNGDCVELTLNGELLDPAGFTIAGSDHVLIRKKGKP